MNMLVNSQNGQSGIFRTGKGDVPGVTRSTASWVVDIVRVYDYLLDLAVLTKVVKTWQFGLRGNFRRYTNHIDESFLDDS